MHTPIKTSPVSVHGPVLCASAATFAIALAVFLAAACKPAAGEACEGSKVSCVDAKSALVCQSGKYIAVACKGSKGCAGEKDAATCDMSGNAAGDACATDGEPRAWCAEGGKAKLECKAGKIDVTPCRGPDGCKGGSCDTSLAEAGDPCHEERSGGTVTVELACSVDGKSQLTCKAGKRVKDRDCPGPRGCQPPTPEHLQQPGWVMCDGNP